MAKKLLLGKPLLDLITTRICHQFIENNPNFSDCVLLGLQPRGVFFADTIHAKLKELGYNIPYGKLDSTFYRDDFRRNNHTLKPSITSVPFLIEGKNVILVDDVLYRGRTVRASLDAMIAFGRPSKVELAVLIDRKYSRELPIGAFYIGKQIDSLQSQKVLVEWENQGAKENAVYLITES